MPTPSLAGGASGDGEDAAPGWFRLPKVTVPEPVRNHVAREALVESAMPTAQRLTLLQAPAGFGKTTLLAECCRRLAAADVPVAWIALEEGDGRPTLATYLAFAFARAGVDAPGCVDDGAERGAGGTEALLRVIEASGTPCVLALDEAERLHDRRALELVNFVLRWGPANLHVAIACRRVPDGLDLSERLLGDRARILSAEDLRFSGPDIARFFDLRLSRKERAALAAETAGWPVALRMRRDELDLGGRRQDAADVLRDVLGAWIESRLWYGVSDADRDFLLDIGLFDWMDAALLDEVLERTDSARRIKTMAVLAGLLETVPRRGVDVWRLHPLLREHSVKRRFTETPGRYRTILGRVADALSRRGETIDAMRAAAGAGDPRLLAETLLRAGGMGLWRVGGLEQLEAADRLLGTAVFERYPRVALLRCAVLAMNGEPSAARRLYELIGAHAFAPLADGEELAVGVDHVLVRHLLADYGCAPLGSDAARAALADLGTAAATDGLDPPTRATVECALCAAHGQRAEFDAAALAAVSARASGAGSPYLLVHLDMHTGTAAMARGCVAEAADAYGRAQRTAKTLFPDDPVLAAQVDVLIKELGVERNRFGFACAARQVAKALDAGGMPFGVIAAAAGVLAELADRERGVDGALVALDAVEERAHRGGLHGLLRHVAALRVAALARAGRVGDAERVWSDAALPHDDDGCIALAGQSWREMEAVACARVRLLAARGAYAAAQALAARTASAASEHGLRRTLMRALGQQVGTARCAGDEAAAVRFAERFLELLSETDYARGLIAEGEHAKWVLTRYLDAGGRWRAAAETVLAALAQGRGNGGALVLSSRESEILARLASQRDKEIAAGLGLTPSGVRYHVTNILAKLGARGRMDAVHRARGIGLLP